MNPLRISFRLVPLLLAPLTCGAATLQIVPGTNNAPISQVIYNINGTDTAPQTTEAADVNFSGNSSVTVKSVRITDGGPVNLTFFNTEGAAVVNVNPQQSAISGIGVYKNGSVTASNSGLPAYAEAVAGTTLDTDLRHYNFRDNLSPGPTTVGTPDFDLLFLRALNPDDYFMVTERWGNAFFKVTALMEDGTPYPMANTLHLGLMDGVIFSPTGYQAYDWNTGFAPASVASQAQAITVFSVRKFFEGTNLNPSPIYGLRIDNDGEADIKIVGASNNTFFDNPLNSKVVPEPSAILLALLGSTCLLRRRRH